jgi:hypothetical protein
MAKKPTHVPQGADWEADWDAGDAEDSGYQADVRPRAGRVDAEPAGPPVRHLDTVADVLAALPAGEPGRLLKLALLDALEASARADRVSLPVEVQGLRARVRAGTA